MNKIMQQHNGIQRCPDCGVFVRDGHRHMSGYKDSLMRCTRQHKRKSDKNGKKGKPPYSRGG